MNSKDRLISKPQKMRSNLDLDLQLFLTLVLYFKVYVFSLFSEEIPIGLRSEDEIMRLFRNQRNKNYNSEKKTRFLTTTENNGIHTFLALYNIR